MSLCSMILALITSIADCSLTAATNKFLCYLVSLRTAISLEAAKAMIHNFAEQTARRDIQ